MKTITQQTNKLNTNATAKLHINAGIQVKELEKKSNQLGEDLANLTMDDEELIAHKQAIDFTQMKIAQLKSQQKTLKDIILDKLYKEDRKRLPQIENELSGLDEKRSALETDMLIHSVTAEVLDHQINSHPDHVHRHVGVEQRKLCQDQKLRIEESLGFANKPTLAAQKQSLSMKRHLINSKSAADYENDFLTLTGSTSNDNSQSE